MKLALTGLLPKESPAPRSLDYIQPLKCSILFCGAPHKFEWCQDCPIYDEQESYLRNTHIL